MAKACSPRARRNAVYYLTHYALWADPVDYGRYADVASHDLQEPLRAVASFAQLLGRRFENEPDVRDYVQHMTAETRRMRELIDGLLAYSSVTAAASGWNRPSRAARCSSSRCRSTVRHHAEPVSVAPVSYWISSILQAGVRGTPRAHARRTFGFR